MSVAGWMELLKVQRRICLRVASAYCTTSRDAIAVITGIAPTKPTRQGEEKSIRKEKEPGTGNTTRKHPGYVADGMGKQQKWQMDVRPHREHRYLDRPPKRRNKLPPNPSAEWSRMFFHGSEEIRNVGNVGVLVLRRRNR